MASIETMAALSMSFKIENPVGRPQERRGVCRALTRRMPA